VADVDHRRVDLLDADTAALRMSYRATSGSWQPCVELHPVNKDLGLFVLLSVRRFLAENSRKKAWKLSGKGSSERTADVILRSLVVPTWNLPSSGKGRNEVVLDNVKEIIEQLSKRFPGRIDPSAYEVNSRAADTEIDSIVGDLYGFSPAERNAISSPREY